MAVYSHGVEIQEQPTSLLAPIEGTAGLQVVFGTAPVNMAADPYGVTNKPVIAYNWAEAVSKLGYSAELKEDGHFLYTLCASMYTSFKLVNVCPVIFVNVLDPKKHKKENAPLTVAVTDGEATVPITGILTDTVKIQVSGAGADAEPMDPAIASVCPLNQGFKGKKYSELVGAGVKILPDGHVVGALPYVPDYTEFSTDAGKQKGHYFPLHLADTYKGKKIKVQRTSGTPGEETEHENETDYVIFLTDGADSVFTFKADDEPEPFLTLDFSRAKLLEDGEALDLQNETDYVLSFDDDGNLAVTVLAEVEAITVTSTSIDPTAVDKDDIIGATAGSDEKGLEVIRQIYPKFGMTPGLLLAPGWSHIPDVGIVLAAKCEEINSQFSCECFIDIDSGPNGATTYSDVKEHKEASGCTSHHAMALWPCPVSGSMKFWFSAVMGSLTAYLDANNEDIPNLSPSNKTIGITGTVLADAKYTPNSDGTGGTWDKEVLLDQDQANTVNGFGVSTAMNDNGWRTWGNNTAAYPSSTDPKDRWFCCRRFFSWWGNSFILTYKQLVDDPANRRLIQTICDTENIRGNSYVAREKCAEARIEFLPDENPVTELIDGKLHFHQYLTPYPPAETITNTLEYNPTALQNALMGG